MPWPRSSRKATRRNDVEYFVTMLRPVETERLPKELPDANAVVP
jgi:hypothetical protein